MPGATHAAWCTILILAFRTSVRISGAIAMTLSGAWDYVLVSNDTEKGGILRLVDSAK